MLKYYSTGGVCVNKIRIMVATESKEGTDAIKNYFNDLTNISVVGYHSDGNAVLNSLRVTDIDVLLLDNVGEVVAVTLLSLTCIFSKCIFHVLLDTLVLPDIDRLLVR